MASPLRHAAGLHGLTAWITRLAHGNAIMMSPHPMPVAPIAESTHDCLGTSLAVRMGMAAPRQVQGSEDSGSADRS